MVEDVKQRLRKAQEKVKTSKKRNTALAEKMRKTLNKEFGDGTFRPIAQASSNIKLRYDTGLYPLNVMLTGNATKGFASGRIVELYGKHQLGKTTLGCTLIGIAQNKCEAVACIVDTESTLTRERALALGVNEDSLIYDEEVYLESILDQIERFVQLAGVNPAVLFWDTIAQSKTKHDKGRKVGEQKVASHAGILSHGMRRLAKVVSGSNVLVLMCNQEKIGQIGNVFATRRDRSATLGGGAVKLAAEVRLGLEFVRDVYEEQRVGKSIKKVPLGMEVAAIVAKNKSGTSNVQARLVLVQRDGLGNFCNARSTLKTLQLWGHYPKGAVRLELCGKKYAPKKWVDAFLADEECRADARERLEASFQEMYL